MKPADPLPPASEDTGAAVALDKLTVIQMYQELALRHNALIKSVLQQCVNTAARTTP